MSIEVTARHKDISAELQQYAKGKAESFIDEFKKVTTVHIVLDFDRHIYTAHLQATVDGEQYVATADDQDNIIKAIDDSFDKAHRQVRKHFDKVAQSNKGL